jgi:hypothetical protein
MRFIVPALLVVMARLALLVAAAQSPLCRSPAR